MDNQLTEEKKQNPIKNYETFVWIPEMLAQAWNGVITNKMIYE